MKYYKTTITCEVLHNDIIDVTRMELEDITGAEVDGYASSKVLSSKVKTLTRNQIDFAMNKHGTDAEFILEVE
jgi:hypothetical protein